MEFSDFKKHIYNKYGEMPDGTLLFVYQLFTKDFYVQTDERTHVQRHRMTLDKYFHLIEYRELSEARENAKEAKIFSWIAIALALITLGLSTWASSYYTDKIIQTNKLMLLQKSILYNLIPFKI